MTLPNKHHYDVDFETTCQASSAMDAMTAIHYSEASITDIRRPLTIAELAVKSAGVLIQPILDGFGIMYFCAFHACKANNGGDIDGTCLPNLMLIWIVGR